MKKSLHLPALLASAVIFAAGATQAKMTSIDSTDDICLAEYKKCTDIVDPGASQEKWDAAMAECKAKFDRCIKVIYP